MRGQDLFFVAKTEGKGLQRFSGRITEYLMTIVLRELHRVSSMLRRTLSQALRER